jgi:hypothetical protein
MSSRIRKASRMALTGWTQCQISSVRRWEQKGVAWLKRSLRGPMPLPRFETSTIGFLEGRRSLVALSSSKQGPPTDRAAADRPFQAGSDFEIFSRPAVCVGRTAAVAFAGGRCLCPVGFWLHPLVGEDSPHTKPAGDLPPVARFAVAQAAMATDGDSGRRCRAVPSRG